MVIDFHSHLDVDSADDLLRRMDLAGIDKLVVFDTDNERVERSVRQHRDRLIGFVFLHPLYSNALAELHHYIEDAGFLGVKMAPTGDYPTSYYPNDPAAYPVYEEIAKLGMPLLYHTGVIFWDPLKPSRAKVKYCLPILLDDVVRDIPNLKLVVAHGGRPFIDQTIALSVCPNVYVEISWSQLPIRFMPQAVEDLLVAFGPDRMLYASDVVASFSPVVLTDRFNYVRHALEYELRLDSASIRKIMGENARELLKLPPKPPGPYVIGPDDPAVENRRGDLK